MKRSFLNLLIFMLVVAPMILGGCSGDSNPAAPTTGSISGTVNFSGTWPSTGDIQISVYSAISQPGGPGPAYLPTGAPDVFTDPIQGPVSSYDFTISGLEKGTYAAVYVGWRDPQNPSGALLLGMFQANHGVSGLDSQGLPSSAPAQVVIEDGKLTHTGIDMTADLSFAP